MKKILNPLIFLVLALILAACGSNDANNASDEKSGAKETITIKHELDETKVTKKPEKIVVFDFGMLDTLDKMGIEVTGVPQAGTIPPYLSKYADDSYVNVGSLKEPDFEKIAEIGPDLIIISGRQAELYEDLKEIGPTVYLGLDTANYMDSFKSNVQTIGKIFGQEEFVEDELAKIDEQIITVKENVAAANKNALIILASEGKINAYGAGSRFGLIHDVLGFTPADEKIDVTTHGQNVSFEYVIETNPDYLFVVDRTAVVGGDTSAKEVVENDLVKNTDAYKEGNIVYLDPNYWYLSGGGLISVTEMITEIDEAVK